MTIKACRFTNEPDSLFLVAQGVPGRLGPISDIVRSARGISVDRLMASFEQALLRGCKTAQEAEEVVRAELRLELN